MTQLTSRISRGVASVGAGLVLAASVGVVGASSHYYGHHDGGKDKGSSVQVKNDNDVHATNNNTQNAVSGDAKVLPAQDNSKCGHDEHSKYHKDCKGDQNGDPSTGGTAKTGNASNDNSSTLGLTIDNTGSTCGCALGDGSGNSSVKVDNDNDVNITNNSVQNAASGDATVIGNGGSASTGNASNSNDTTFDISVSN